MQGFYFEMHQMVAMADFVARLRENGISFDVEREDHRGFYIHIR